MNLWAISDLHVGYEENRRAVAAVEAMHVMTAGSGASGSCGYS